MCVCPVHPWLEGKFLSILICRWLGLGFGKTCYIISFPTLHDCVLRHEGIRSWHIFPNVTTQAT